MVTKKEIENLVAVAKNLGRRQVRCEFFADLPSHARSYSFEVNAAQQELDEKLAAVLAKLNKSPSDK